MPYSPATPDKKSFKDGSIYSAKVAVPALEKLSTSKVKQASLHEPSPASTYGDTVAGDSVPATPQEIDDPAIIIRSFQSTHLGDANDYTGESTGSRGTSHRYAHPVVSAGSSPDTQRKKDIMESPSWRRGGGAFVQESAGQPDPFTTQELPTQTLPDNVGTLQFRPREDRAGLQIDGDNAQAVLPPNACVFVANLSTSRTDDQLEHSVHREFSAFGTVYVKIRRDNRQMPYAFCQYEHVSDSERAIENGRGLIIDGRSCRTERARVNRSLYLSRISGGSISEAEAGQVLSKYGALERVWYCTPTDKEMYRLPDGIWVMFAYFQDCRDAQSGMRDSTTHRLEQPPIPDDVCSRRINRQMASPIARASPNRDFASPQARIRRAVDRCFIFVGNLPSSITQEQLTELFGLYGHIHGIEIISRPSVHVTTGVNVFAFIEFALEEEALRAVSSQTFLHGMRLRVELKESAEHVPRRIVAGSSAGSPRARVGPESPESLTPYYHRALAMGLNPAAAATLFNVHSAQSMSPSALTGPVYSPYQSYYPYYATQYGPYQSPAPNPEGETAGTVQSGTQIHGTTQHISPSMGQFQYAQAPSAYVPYATYPAMAPYVYPPANEDGNTALIKAGSEANH